MTERAGSNGHGDGLGHRLRRWFAPRKVPPPVNPALLKHTEQRAEEAQNRVADWIQNRADAKRQVLADQQWRTVQEEDRQNRELIHLSKQILGLTRQVRSFGDTIQQERDQNTALLDLSKQTLALTQALHAASGAAPPAA
jgi:hypothetical protein